MQWPWVSRLVYISVLRQLAAERRRAERLSDSLELERQANRSAERFWANALLRAKGSPGMAEPAKPLPPLQPVGPQYDTGELAALIEAGAELGRSREDVIAFFRKEKGLPDDLKL